MSSIDGASGISEGVWSFAYWQMSRDWIRMKKWLFGAGIVLCLGAGGLAVYQKLKSDRQVPQISITGNFTYQDGMEEEELLSGVTAWDEQDGDVTASLIVETVTINSAEHTAVIHYAARDQENNVSKASRTVEYQSSGLGEESEQETEEDSSATAAGTSGTGKASLGRTETNGGTGAGSNAAGLTGPLSSGQTGLEMESESESETETEPESESEELEPGQPVLRMKSLSATIKAGETFDPLAYVDSIEDDYDNIYDLWRNIQMEGEYDTEKLGRYELTFYVTDSSGNISNRAKFLLRVTEN